MGRGKSPAGGQIARYISKSHAGVKPVGIKKFIIFQKVRGKPEFAPATAFL
jgi:hypothetical protein